MASWRKIEQGAPQFAPQVRERFDAGTTKTLAEALGIERGHRPLTIVRKGGKTVTIPLAPRTARAVALAVGKRGTTDRV